jgi:hypothetical protein
MTIMTLMAPSINRETHLIYQVHCSLLISFSFNTLTLVTDLSVGGGTSRSPTFGPEPLFCRSEATRLHRSTPFHQPGTPCSTLPEHVELSRSLLQSRPRLQESESLELPSEGQYIPRLPLGRSEQKHLAPSVGNLYHREGYIPTPPRTQPWWAHETKASPRRWEARAELRKTSFRTLSLRPSSLHQTTHHQVLQTSEP